MEKNLQKDKKRFSTKRTIKKYRKVSVKKKMKYVLDARRTQNSIPDNNCEKFSKHFELPVNECICIYDKIILLLTFTLLCI